MKQGNESILNKMRDENKNDKIQIKHIPNSDKIKIY